MARGRRKKAGDRYACGKLKPLRDPGNVRVRAHREIFLRHGSVKSADDLDCAIGQAHAAGLLEGTRIDGRLLMEHGREYHRLYRGEYGGGVRTTRFERTDRSAPSLAVTASDLRYAAWSRVIGELAREDRAVLHAVCVEHGDGWTLPPFLDRLVGDWRARHGGPPHHPPTPADRDALDRLKMALVALAEGPRRRRA